MKNDTVVSPPHQPWDIDCSRDKILTKQEFIKDCDVNEILKRCLRTNSPLPGADVQSAFFDASEIPDFSESMRRITAAQDAFSDLPAELRAQFNHEPANLIAFVQDERNYDEALKLGIIAAKPLPPAAPAAVAPITPAKA